MWATCHAALIRAESDRKENMQADDVFPILEYLINHGCRYYHSVSSSRTSIPYHHSVLPSRMTSPYHNLSAHLLISLSLRYISVDRAEQRFGSVSMLSSTNILQVNPGRTPMQLLATVGAVKCVQFLLQHGGSILHFDVDGWTPLLAACTPSGRMKGDNSEMVLLLLQAGAQVNQASAEGLTPVSAAAHAADPRWEMK